MHSFDCQPKQWNAEWCAQMSLRMKIVWGSQDALKVMHILFFSQNGLVLDHPVPIGMTVIGQYYCALLLDKMRPAVCLKQQELLEHGVMLLQDNSTSHHHCGLQDLLQRWCWEILAHPFYSPDFTPCDY
jgi:hypothetical protein